MELNFELETNLADATISFLESQEVELDEDFREAFLDYIRDNNTIFIDFSPIISSIMETKLSVYILLNANNDSDYEFAKNRLELGRRLKSQEVIGTGVSWGVFLKSQGYTSKDLIDFLDPDRLDLLDDIFLNNCRDEIDELTSDCCAITFLGTCNVKTFIDVFSKNQKIVNISKKCECGLFDPIMGSGSVLGIELQKDIKIPSNKVIIQLSDYSTYGYNIQDVYGLHRLAFEKGKIF